MPRAPNKIALGDKVLAYIRRHELLRAGDRVGVAVSGGADSVALLRLLLELRDELGVVLSVVHFNHKIRGADANADEQFVAALAERYHLPMHLGCGDVPAYAASQSLGLETAARELRYNFFRRLLQDPGLTKIATAHSLDDQAETVLLRLLRGAWTKGLAGIYPKWPVVSGQLADTEKQTPCVARDDQGERSAIVRPFLEIRRGELEHYLRSLGQEWREDATNLDVNHARNRVRHALLPLLERDFNPGIRQVLAETADIARAEEGYWSSAVASELSFAPPGLSDADSVTHGLRRGLPSSAPPALQVDALIDKPLALQRRMIRSFAEALGVRLDFQQLETALQLARGERSGSLELPDGWTVGCQGLRRPSTGPVLVFEKYRPVESNESQYEYVLPVPGQIWIPETGKRLIAHLLELRQEASSARAKSQYSGYNRQQLLDPLSLGSELRVRNWRPGDRFWPAHTKSPKKVKELLQARHISGRERTLWPVAVRGNELVWMRGFPVPEQFAAKPESAQGLLIEESENASLVPG